MRKIFAHYHRPTQDEFKTLWSKGTFVFDTNVLLNLYRYPRSSREAFFSVFEKIKNKIWIPYHVGLEFHQNRFERIRDENNTVTKVIASIENNHGKIIQDINKLTGDQINSDFTIDEIRGDLDLFNESYKNILKKINSLKNNLHKSDLEDEIGVKIANLFEKKVGFPPKSKEELDELISDYDDRINNNMPPGFKDTGKNGNMFDGKISYDRKHGDLILWKQILNHVKINNIKYIIFVTDDEKEDWWAKQEGKTRGPHPLLLQEMKLFCDVDQFWIYNSKTFLEHSHEHVNSPSVTREVIQNVAELSIRHNIDGEIDNYILQKKKNFSNKNLISRREFEFRAVLFVNTNYTYHVVEFDSDNHIAIGVSENNKRTLYKFVYQVENLGAIDIFEKIVRELYLIKEFTSHKVEHVVIIFVVPEQFFDNIVYGEFENLEKMIFDLDVYEVCFSVLSNDKIVKVHSMGPSKKLFHRY